jgi:hypothetical protein
MKRWDIGEKSEKFPDFVRLKAQSLNLKISESQLRSFPENIHWHLSRPKEKGVLEITWLKESKTVWLNVHPNRDADWIEEIVQHFLI